MAKLELPKLASWVRFPSLAPKSGARYRAPLCVVVGLQRAGYSFSAGRGARFLRRRFGISTAAVTPPASTAAAAITMSDR